jgi:hypothetical protein
MNDCLGCAEVPLDDGFISFIMGLVDNSLRVPLIIKSALLLLILPDHIFRLFIDVFNFKTGEGDE